MEIGGGHQVHLTPLRQFLVALGARPATSSELPVSTLCSAGFRGTAAT